MGFADAPWGLGLIGKGDTEMAKAMLVAVLPIVMILSAGPEAGMSDEEAIKKTALDYGLGWYEGDGPRCSQSGC